jgi:sugar phosphate isomerase/epimerase
MKFSIFTVMLPDWDAATAVKKLKAYGYDGVEWRVTNTRPEVKKDAPSYWGNNYCTVELDTIVEKAKDIRKLTDEAGIETAALAGYHRVEDMDATEKMIAAAKIMGAKILRVGVSRYDGTRHFDELFKESRKGYEKASKLAAKAGVKICVETHMGLICASASGARRILDGLDPKTVGVIYDPGNMVTEGYEETKMGLEILGPYLAHVHGKNGSWVKKTDVQPGEHPWTSGIASPVDEGIVDWRKVLRNLKEVGYNGYISFEDFSNVRSTEEKVKFNIGYIKSLM